MLKIQSGNEKNMLPLLALHLFLFTVVCVRSKDFVVSIWLS